MVDTFHPLYLTREAAELEDANYPYSWLPPENASEQAAAAIRARPGGFPGLSYRAEASRPHPASV